jgi:RNA polymerase sigma-70 factor, ECF subfamily
VEAPRQAEITRWLVEWTGGDRAALDRLMPYVYSELCRIASRQMRAEHARSPLQTTALVHEAYLRLIDQDSIAWQNRAHFFSICAKVIRQILVDQARAKLRLKRGAGGIHVCLEPAVAAGCVDLEHVLAVSNALDKLGKLDERKSLVIELRFFGGLDVEETAEVLKVSANTVIRDWRLAKAWLQKELESGA